MIKSSKKLNKLFTEMMDLCENLGKDFEKYFEIYFHFLGDENPDNVIKEILLAFEKSKKRNVPLIRVDDLNWTGYGNSSVYLILATEKEIEIKLNLVIKELKNLEKTHEEEDARAKKSSILKEMQGLKQRLSTLKNSLKQIKPLESINK